jgi:hypothetical protein
MDKTTLLQYKNHDHNQLDTATYRIIGRKPYNPHKYKSNNEALFEWDRTLTWELISSPRKLKQLKPGWVPNLDLSWVDKD